MGVPGQGGGPGSARLLSVVIEQHLQPAGAGGDELSGVAGPPPFSEADADAVGVPGPLLALGFHAVLRQPAGVLVVKHLEGEARHHPLHAQPPAAGGVQGGRVDEHRVLAAVVHPHAVGLPAQHDAVADFTANLLHAAAAVASAAVGPAPARLVPAAAVGVGVELAETQARALR